MRRTLFVTAAGAAAVVPAVIGLTGNPALSHQVPVRVPAHVVPVSAHDLAARADDNPGSDDRTVTPTSSPHAKPSDDRGDARTRVRTTRTVGRGDDRGGARTRARTGTPEPGDDHGGTRAIRTAEPGDDHGGKRGGNDDAPGDDHGRNRHGGGDDGR